MGGHIMVVKKLFSPGPVLVEENVRNSLLHYDICHRSQEFEELFKAIQNKILALYNADSSYYPLVISGSGTSANESVLSSVIRENDEVLLITNGVFGERLLEILDCYRIKTIKASFKWGEYPSLEKIEELLKNNPGIALVAMVHHETSTGMINPVHEVGKLCRQYQKIFFVDAVSAFAGEEIDVIKDNIDFITSVGGKCVAAFPGSAFICSKKEHLEKLNKSQCRNVYLSLFKHYESAKNNNQTPNTPNVTLFWALDQALGNIMTYGKSRWIEGHAELARYIRAGVKRLGMRLLLSEHMSNTVTSVFLPENIDLQTFLNEMEDRGYVLYMGKGDYAKQNMFQIANMGNITKDDCDAFLNELEKCLCKLSK